MLPYPALLQVANSYIQSGMACVAAPSYWNGSCWAAYMSQWSLINMLSDSTAIPALIAAGLWNQVLSVYVALHSLTQLPGVF